MKRNGWGVFLGVIVLGTVAGAVLTMLRQWTAGTVVLVIMAALWAFYFVYRTAGPDPLRGMVAPRPSNLVSTVMGSSECSVTDTEAHAAQIWALRSALERGHDPVEDCVVALVPQPAKSKTAVRCEALVTDPFRRFLIGYLPKPEATVWRPVTSRLAASGKVLVVVAKVVVADENDMGQFILLLPSVEQADNAAPIELMTHNQD